MSIEIKPCPFCDDADVVIRAATHSISKTWWVECDNCDACGPVLQTEYDAVRIWNNVPRAVLETLDAHKATATPGE